MTDDVCNCSREATTFTITATPNKDDDGNDGEGCNAVSEDTETDYDDNELQKATLTSVQTALGGAECQYTVTAVVPPGFAAGAGGPRDTGNQVQQSTQVPLLGRRRGGPSRLCRGFRRVVSLDAARQARGRHEKLRLRRCRRSSRQPPAGSPVGWTFP